MFGRALAGFAADLGLGRDKRVVFLLDGADWHEGRNVVVPEWLHLVKQPRCSSELQPAEQLWPLVNEVVANRTFGDMDAQKRRWWTAAVT